MCPKDELATLLGKPWESAAGMYRDVCDIVESSDGAAMRSDRTTCSLHATLPAFPAVKTFGKAAKPPHTGLTMPSVTEQLQISANHFANSLVVLWATVTDNEDSSSGVDSATGYGEHVWGVDLLTKQVRLVSSTPLTTVKLCARTF
jgi:hypothetical protein